MKIAVVQHQSRPAPAQDLESLVLACVRAAMAGAGLVVLPDVEAVHSGPLGDELYRRIEEDSPGLAVFVARADEHDVALLQDLPDVGRVTLLSGDACFDCEVLAEVSEEKPGVAIMAPRSESELQAEAALEVAIALSTSLASLVIVAEPDGEERGEPGHGGSAIIHLGEVLAEAMAGDDLLFAEVTTPLGSPESPAALPEIPSVLAQRICAHRGLKVEVSYPADLD